MKSPKAEALEVAQRKEQERKNTIIAEKFPSLKEIISDPKFTEFSNNEISKQARERANFNKPGFRLRRNAFDQLSEKGKMNAKIITEEYEKIKNGVSKEPFAIRSYIVQLVSQISRQVITYYSKNI
jgi:flagellar biosynthesis/type III secretory pathway protein FliH